MVAQLSPPIISVQDLHRSFGNVHAVRGISFEIQPGSVVGFIGANGSGKTTTLRILSTLDQPSSGRAEVFGYDVVNHPQEVRLRLGWMPDEYGTYQHMNVVEYLDFYARAFDLRGAQRRERMAEVMQFTDLEELAERPMQGLSKGQAQRLCLARTLLNDPELLIMDEPAAGLDPKARIEFKRLVRLLAERGKTIFISSHILSELGEMCDSLLFIDAGQIVHHGSAESLQRGGTEVFVDVQVEGDPAALATWAAMQQGVKFIELRAHGARLQLESPEPAAAAAVLRRLVLDGLPVTEFHRETRRLEDAFVEMLKRVGSSATTPATPPPLPPPLPV